MGEFSLNDEQKQQLLSLARQSIEHGLRTGKPLKPTGSFEPVLKERVSCFVTITIQGELRGCLGSLEPRRPLVEDVCENAYACAFHDSRFRPLRTEEFESVHIEISVLTPLEPMNFESEADLLSQIVPFKDGLLLCEGRRSATFLPLVWDKIPDKFQFLTQLKKKAELPEYYWSDSIECFRYHALVFEE